MDPEKKYGKLQEERTYRGISSLFFLNEFEYCSFLSDSTNNLNNTRMTLRGHDAQIRSGLKDGHEVEVWEPRLQLIEQALYQKFFPKRWGFGGILMGKFPGICKKFSSLLGYKIN